MSQKQADIKPIQRVMNAVRKAVGIIVPTLTCTAAALYITSVLSPDLAIEATVNGTNIGAIASVNALIGAKAELESSVYTLTEGKYDTNYDIELSFAEATSENRLTREDCYSLLWGYVEDDFTEAYMIYVDDRQAAANESEADLIELFENIENEIFESLGSGFSDVQIASRVRIEKQYCLKAMLKSVEEINTLLNPLANKNGEYITTRMSTVSAAVPSAPTENTAAAPNTRSLALDYNFLNTVNLDEVVYFNTVYVDDEENFIGNEEIAVEGSNGLRNATYEIVYGADGTIIGRNLIEATVITEAVDRVIKVGTAPIPDAVPTGSLIWPCKQPYGISSYYGWRDLYGKADFHLGIDIPDNKGSSIWAADGGEVIFAGYTPSYGYNVKIQHSDSTMTVYAHLDKILVSVGDKVYQKQKIGTMGRTGVAYGVHLHFEVRINNKTTNPLKYLPK